MYRTDFSSLDALRKLAGELDCPIGFDEDVSPLRAPIRAGDLTFPNRIAIQPMEGADSDPKGSPTEHTRERYLGYARGGAGIIWFEACAVDFPEARTHNKMLVINGETLPHFERLLEDAKAGSEECLSELGLKSRAAFVLQLSHAGRYRAERTPTSPAMAYRFPVLERAFGISGDVGRVVTDEELEEMRGAFVDAASLAFDAGFDAVDVKACHGYLLNDLLSAFTREGEYGGEEFENRSRFLLETVSETVKETGGSVTTRLNAYDGISRPYGFGTTTLPGSDGSKYAKLTGFDPVEPIRLVQELEKAGIDFVNISLGNPYYSQFLTRPFDVKMPGQRESPEHPMRQVARHFEVVETLKREAPDMVFIGSGYSWLRQHGVNAAAYNIAHSRTDIAGWGRLSFAFPGFPREALSSGSLPPSKVCVTCSGCSRLLRGGFEAGCVVQSPGTYRESMRRLAEQGK
jgi:2,4-dienoyl-CoA reductase (NADPH2)